MLALLAVLAFTAPAVVRADTPANCTYSEFLGDWTVSLSNFFATPAEPSMNCDFAWNVVESRTLTLSYPNIATLEVNGNSFTGNWTLIYNQGIEVWVGGDILFAFSAYDNAGTDLCGKSQVAWQHSTLNDRWRCAAITKISDKADSPAAQARAAAKADKAHVPSDVAALNAELRAERLSDPLRLSRKYKTDRKFLAAVNKAAKGQFTVREYPEFEGMTIGDLERRRGARAAAQAPTPFEMQIPSTAVKQERQPRLRKEDIPANFDWRNVSGVNYVSPVRDQGQCGSCYAFSSAGMMEARIRVKSKNQAQPILSTQDVVSCSLYSQGCEGGFPYLIGGKYARDYGFIEENCYPYAGVDSLCTPPDSPTNCNPERWHADAYYYIGGYYGQSNPQVMQEEIMANGPISVSFMVYDDFMHYGGGVYTHKFAEEAGLLSDSYNPFELTNHAVLCVGWGVTDDASQTPYWIVKNSWSTSWGEQGYFRILRSLEKSPVGGECAIESITVASIPLLH